MTEHPLLVVEGLGHDIGPRTLWDDLTLSVAEGTALALRGPSGQGKSTLLRCLAGLEPPTRGRVLVDGLDLHAASERERRILRRDTIGIVTQDHAVVPEWTVKKNLTVIRPRGMTAREREARIRDALLVVGLNGRGSTRAGLLSGGEQQRVAVARVLAQQPRLVLADEPTASLDDVSAERVRLGLDALRERGTAVVVATHDPALLERVGCELDLGASVGIR